MHVKLKKGPDQATGCPEGGQTDRPTGGGGDAQERTRRRGERVSECAREESKWDRKREKQGENLIENRSGDYWKNKGVLSVWVTGTSVVLSSSLFFLVCAEEGQNSTVRALSFPENTSGRLPSCATFTLLLKHRRHGRRR